ncbi:MAG: hypothetical protein KDM63_21600 [Verrucomicrobiae bacterium]|nr:hypothetical protein [Verrucomicrobiae bacterium]
MRDPRNTFVNPFDTESISFNQMAALTTDHIGKLGNQNTLSGGQWNAQLTATLTAMADFDDTITDERVQGNFRKARKQAKNALRETLPETLRIQVANWVQAAFGAGSPELTSVVGSGVNELRKLPDDEVENYLQGVITGLTPLIGNGVDAQRLTDATALKAQWDAVYAASEGASASKRLSEEERRAAKTALADVLFSTLLDIAQANRGNPDVLANFFTPSLAGGPPISGGGGGGGNGGGSDPSETSSLSSDPSSSSLSSLTSSFSMTSSFSESFSSMFTSSLSSSLSSVSSELP